MKQLISMVVIRSIYITIAYDHLASSVKFINDKTVRINFSGANAYLETVELSSTDGETFATLIQRTMRKGKTVKIFAKACEVDFN